MKLSFIRFCDTDICDGQNAATVLMAIHTDNGITNGDKERLQKIVDELKEENEEWQFDEVVDDACAKYFKPLDIEYETVVEDAVIYL